MTGTLALRVLLVVVTGWIVTAARAAPQLDPPPRAILRLDLGVRGGAEPSAWGGGGGFPIPIGGTGVGLESTPGVEMGAEIRLTRWTGLDIGAGYYRPALQVGRDQGPSARGDLRTGSAALQTLSLGLVVTPPTWRSEKGRLAVAATVTRAEVSGAPPELGISVQEQDIGLGVDIRGEYLFSKDGHWGVGGALAFVNLGFAFEDLETGYHDSVEMSILHARIGVRGAW